MTSLMVSGTSSFCSCGRAGVCVQGHGCAGGGVHVHVASAFAGGSQRGRWPSRTAQDDVSSESGRARGRAHSLRPHSLNLALDDVVEEVDVVEFAKVLQILWRQRRRM